MISYHEQVRREMKLASLCGLAYVPERIVHCDWFIHGRSEDKRCRIQQIIEISYLSVDFICHIKKIVHLGDLKKSGEADGRWRIAQSHDDTRLSADAGTNLDKIVHFDGWHYVCV